jgi:hypothetical protein
MRLGAPGVDIGALTMTEAKIGRGSDACLSCDTSEASKMRKWWARIRNGKELEHLGTLRSTEDGAVLLIATKDDGDPQELQRVPLIVGHSLNA